MQNKYLIKASKKLWFWFWNQLMNGFAPSDLYGNYKRPKGITIDSRYDINNENGQIYLLIGFKLFSSILNCLTAQIGLISFP